MQIDFWHDESTTGEMIRADSIESSRIDNIFNPPCLVQGRYISYVSRKSTSGMTNQQKGKQFMSIRLNRLKSTTFLTHPQCPAQLYFLSLGQIDFQHVESTEGETIRVDSMG